MASSEQENCASNLGPDDPLERIRQLNDSFRQQLIGGRVMMTNAVEALGLIAVTAILDQLRQFDDFHDANDPFQEHDFGSFKSGSETVFWKIDYFDKDLMYGSSDPADPDVTTRVLTIMLASDY